MSPDERDWLLATGILAMGETVARRLEMTGMTRERFVEDESEEARMDYDAILMPVFVLTEDMGKLSEKFERDHPEIPWADISYFRNIVAHAYQEVRRETAWDVVTKDVPALVQQLKALGVGSES